MTLRNRARNCAAAALLLLCCLSSAVRATPYLSAEIESALAARSEFLKSFGMSGEEFSSFEAWIESPNNLQKLKSRFASAPAGPWPHYIRGLMTDDGDKAAEYYGRALEEADVGALWLLSLEFIRYGEYPWADETLEAIQKKIAGDGGSYAPLLSMKLMLMGNGAAKSIPEQAEFCYKWAAKFDPNQSWWAYKKGGINFPRNIADAAPGFISESIHVLINSWRAQVSLICGIYRYITVTLFIFAGALILAFAVKYLPSGAHHIGDLLFRGASPRFRTFSSVAVVVSVFFIGALPALWLIAFLTYRFLGDTEKKVMMLACAILAASPLNHYATNFLRHNLSPTSAATLLDRALSEGYSGALHERLAAEAAKKPGNYANQLALAVSYTKKGDYQSAETAAEKALTLAPDDMAALMYAGNIAFLQGDLDGMEDRYLKNLIERYPKSARARYNLAQAYVGEGKLAASDIIADAAKIDASLISDYMRKNEQYFAGSPPPLRKVMQPAVTPGYFWGRLAILDAKSAAGSGTTHLAIFGASALLFIILAALGASIWGKNKPRAREYFVCRICGRLLCRRCRKGTTCASCHRACLDSNNDAVTMYNLQKACKEKALMRSRITKNVLGMAIPGAGQLYKGEPAFKPAVVILISCAVYAAFYCSFTFKTAYPSVTVINPLYFAGALLIYNITAIVRQSVELSASLKKR